jgi:hypothetical protein
MYFVEIHTDNPQYFRINLKKIILDKILYAVGNIDISLS